MRRLLIALGFAAAVASPAAALTITAAPNRDQAPHLRQDRAPGGGVDFRDSLAADQRPGAGYSDNGGYRRTQTFGFGDVTTTVTTGPEPDLRRPSYIPGRPAFVQPEWVSRRR